MARNGDGIYTRKDRPGYWISYKDADGRRRRIKVEAANKTIAGDLRSGRVSREEIAKAHGVRPPGPEVFADVAREYLAHQKPRISSANYRREAGIIEDHLKPFFAGELRAIRRATVARCACVSAATVTKELNVLKHLLRLAVEEWEYLPVNPIPRSMRPPKPAPGRVRYLQPSELRILLQTAPPWLRTIIALAVATGMRRGEILGLRWLDIDLNGSRILLTHTKNGWDGNAFAREIIDRLVTTRVVAGPRIKGKSSYRLEIQNRSPLVLNSVAIGVEHEADGSTTPTLYQAIALPPERKLVFPIGETNRHETRVLAADLSSL